MVKVCHYRFRSSVLTGVIVHHQQKMGSWPFTWEVHGNWIWCQLQKLGCPNQACLKGPFSPCFLTRLDANSLSKDSVLQSWGYMEDFTHVNMEVSGRTHEHKVMHALSIPRIRPYHHLAWWWAPWIPIEVKRNGWYSAPHGIKPQVIQRHE